MRATSQWPERRRFAVSQSRRLAGGREAQPVPGASLGSCRLRRCLQCRRLSPRCDTWASLGTRPFVSGPLLCIKIIRKDPFSKYDHILGSCVGPQHLRGEHDSALWLKAARTWACPATSSQAGPGSAPCSPRAGRCPSQHVLPEVSGSPLPAVTSPREPLLCP